MTLLLCVFLVENFNYEGLKKALEQVAEFEKRANTRVVNSGVLKGLHLEDIKRAGQRLILQEGCRGFFQKIVKNDTLKTLVHVLSYSWCGDLIRSAFSSGIVFEVPLCMKFHRVEIFPCIRCVKKYYYVKRKNEIYIDLFKPPSDSFGKLGLFI